MYEERYSNVVDFDRLQQKAHRETRHTGRDDRATSEQVLDPRTRLLLFKMMSSGVLTEINGCISTGKEVRGQWSWGALASWLTASLSSCVLRNSPNAFVRLLAWLVRGCTQHQCTCCSLLMCSSVIQRCRQRCIGSRVLGRCRTLLSSREGEHSVHRATGLQANVYHAVGADGQDLAVKVYKTSILVFKDRCVPWRCGCQHSTSFPWYTVNSKLKFGCCGSCGAVVLSSCGAVVLSSCGLVVLPSQGSLCHGRVPVSARLLSHQPAQDGEDVGRERDAKPETHSPGGHRVAVTTAAALPRPGHGVLRQ